MYMESYGIYLYIEGFCFGFWDFFAAKCSTFEIHVVELLVVCSFFSLHDILLCEFYPLLTDTWLLLVVAVKRDCLAHSSLCLLTPYAFISLRHTGVLLLVHT